MRTISNCLIVFPLILLLNSCGASQKIEALKPEPTREDISVYRDKTSFISLPTSIHLEDIERQMNKYVTGLLFEDGIIPKDKTEIKIWKTKDLSLVEKNGDIITKIPLKIWVKVYYGTDFLGLNDTRELNFDGTLTLLSKPHLFNWKLTTKSTFIDLEWNESPNIVIAGKKVPITYLVNPALLLFKKEISASIDEAIDATCDFKPQVLEAIGKMSVPFETNSSYETWFKMEPLELFVTEAILKNEKITMNMGLKCNMKTVVGEIPANDFNAKKLVLKPVSKMPESFTVSMAAVSTYESASKIITKNFKGETFGSGNKSVTVQKVSIWEKDTKLIIGLDLLGSVNGTIYLSGFPKFNALTNEIYFDDLDYVLDTKNVLLKSANWLAQGFILKKIKESCTYSLVENLQEGKTTMLQYLNNYSPMKGVFINGNLNDFVFEKVALTDEAIIAFITTSGKINVTINGLE